MSDWGFDTWAIIVFAMINLAGLGLLFLGRDRRRP